jgi:dihydroorotate dehydrogenase (NAD+) catalytic subunit
VTQPGALTQPGAPVPDLAVTLAGLRLEHPVLNASGTFDALETARHYGPEALAPFPFSAYVPKTVTLERRDGNPPPRLTETAAGMINAVGLQNPGIEAYLDDLPLLAFVPVPVLVNIGGRRPGDYLEVLRRVEERLAAGAAGSPQVAGYELNVSCPNVGRGGLAVGTEPGETEKLTAAARALTKRLLIVKLTPNVTDVVAVARAAAEAGADALSLVNTVRALVLDPQTLTPFLGNRTGGLSGPAIKPVALRMVWEVAGALDAPIIGMGGIACGRDVLEFVACGATAVAVGAANFSGPDAPRRIVAELRAELVGRGLPDLAAVRGRALV